MERALPAMRRAALSRSAALRSFIFVWAISRHWSIVTLQIVSLPVAFAPEVIPAARFRKKVAGGVLVTKVKLLSWYTVMTVGRGVPFSISAVRALNSLQKPMMFTPR